MSIKKQEEITLPVFNIIFLQEYCINTHGTSNLYAEIHTSSEIYCLPHS